MMMINVDIAFWSVLCWKINIDNIACLCLCLCIYIYTYIVLHVIFAYMDWLIDLIDVVHACPFSTWYMIMNSYIHTHKDTHIHIFAYSHFYIHTVIYIYILCFFRSYCWLVFLPTRHVLSRKNPPRLRWMWIPSFQGVTISPVLHRRAFREFNGEGCGGNHNHNNQNVLVFLFNGNQK